MCSRKFVGSVVFIIITSQMFLKLKILIFFSYIIEISKSSCKYYKKPPKKVFVPILKSKKFYKMS